MTHEFEFHDSSIESIALNGDNFEMKLMAALIITDDDGNWLDEEELFVPTTIRMSVKGAAKLPRAETVISDGEFTEVEDLEDGGIIPANFSYSGACGLTVTTDDGVFKFTGRNLEIKSDLSSVPANLK